MDTKDQDTVFQVLGKEFDNAYFCTHVSSNRYALASEMVVEHPRNNFNIKLSLI